MIIFDILRIAAAFMVFTIHLFIFIPQLPRSVCDVLSNGGYGVSVFFVISGFLIFQSIEHSDSLKEYYVKRVSRIVPSYYAILLVAIVVWDGILHQMPEDTFLHLGWLRYFLFLHTWLPSAEYDLWNNLWGLWTISCFAFFYLIAPAIKNYVDNFKKSVWFMGIMMVSTFVLSKGLTVWFTKLGASVPNMLAVDNPLYSLNTFSIGICGYYAYKEKKERKVIQLFTVFLVTFIGFNVYNRVLWGLLTGLLMMSFLDAGMSEGKLKKVIKTAGKYSFSLYLVHLPVLKMLEYYGFSGGYFLLAGVGGSVVAAVVLYHLVEKPCAMGIKKLLLER